LNVQLLQQNIPTAERFSGLIFAVGVKGTLHL